MKTLILFSFILVFAGIAVTLVRIFNLICQPVLRYLWYVVYHNYLDGRVVTKVKGWRTAILKDKYGNIQCITPCFKLFGIKFD